jgi:hypothetical protein
MLGDSIKHEAIILDMLDIHGSISINVANLSQHVPGLRLLPDDLIIFKFVKLGRIIDFYTLTVLYDKGILGCYSADISPVNDFTIESVDMFYGRLSILRYKDLRLVADVSLKYFDRDCIHDISEDVNTRLFKDNYNVELDRDDLNLVGMVKGFDPMM